MISALVSSRVEKSRVGKSAQEDDPEGDDHEGRPLYIPACEVCDGTSFPRTWPCPIACSSVNVPQGQDRLGSDEVKSFHS